MKDEIKKIIDRLERIDNKEYNCSFEFADSASFEEMSRCFDERNMMSNYIIYLQEENMKHDEILIWYMHQNKENVELIMDLLKEIDYLKGKGE